MTRTSPQRCELASRGGQVAHAGGLPNPQPRGGVCGTQDAGSRRLVPATTGGRATPALHGNRPHRTAVLINGSSAGHAATAVGGRRTVAGASSYQHAHARCLCRHPPPPHGTVCHEHSALLPLGDRIKNHKLITSFNTSRTSLLRCKRAHQPPTRLYVHRHGQRGTRKTGREEREDQTAEEVERNGALSGNFWAPSTYTPTTDAREAGHKLPRHCAPRATLTLTVNTQAALLTYR